jgi:hypothetical protein
MYKKVYTTYAHKGLTNLVTEGISGIGSALAAVGMIVIAHTTARLVKTLRRSKLLFCSGLTDKCNCVNFEVVFDTIAVENAETEITSIMKEVMTIVRRGSSFIMVRF